MDMIKCFWYWKLLKQLFIISLISCSIFLVDSSVNAWYSRQIWVYWFQPYDESVNVNVLTKGTLNSELIWEVKRLFWFNEWNYFKWDYSSDLWWVSMYAVNQIFGSNGYHLNQGFVNDYLICNKTITWVSLDWSISSNYYTGCTKYTISSWNLQTIKNFTSSIRSTDYYWFDFDSSTACTQAVICFSSEEYWKSLCFWNSIKWTDSFYNNCYPYFFINYWAYNWWNTVYSKSYWTGWGSADSEYSSPSVDIAPIPEVISTWNTEVVYYSDNNQVYYDFFECLWFTSDICYSNFSLNDIVDSNTTYFDLFPSGYISWATVFDLYNSWNYNFNPFYSWFNYYKNRYFSVESDKSNDAVLFLYSWDSKWNYYLFNKLDNSYYISSYQFNPQDYFIYCNMVVNWFNPDWLFTWKTSESFNNVFLSSDVRSDNSICSNWQFHFYLSWSNMSFSWTEDMFWVFNSLYSQFKNAFYVDSSLTWTVWFLPRYIILGFFLFLLLYIFKR
jgi:hypothetical protein